MNDLNIDTKPKAVDKFIKSADMTKTDSKVRSRGRPKKKESEKANKQVFINLTEEQKNKLDTYTNSLLQQL